MSYNDKYVEIDHTEKVADFLKENGKLFEHRDYEGTGRRIHVFEIPSALKKEFFRLYYRAWTDWENRWYFDDSPTDNKILYVLKGDIEEIMGEYHFRMAGYDEDGFYCHGEAGTHKCESYVKIYPIKWYLTDFTLWGGQREEFVPGGKSFGGMNNITVAFMKK